MKQTKRTCRTVKNRCTKVFIPLLLLLSLALLLNACGNGGAASDSMGMDIQESAPAPEYDKNYGSATDNEMGFESPSVEDSAEGSLKDETVVGKEEDATDRKVIKTAAIRAETLEFDAFVADMKSTVADLGGYLSSSNISGYESRYEDGSYTTLRRQGSFTIKIPSENYESFLTTVGGLGNLLSCEEAESDVTLQYVDIESRIKAYRAEEESLLAMLQQSKNVSELIEIQDRLSSVRYHIETYQSQLNVLQNQVSYSTVTLTLTEVKEITRTDEYTSIWDEIGTELGDNLSDIGQGFRDFFVWLVSNLPYLLLIAIFFGAQILIIFLIVRRISRRRKQARKAVTDNTDLPPKQHS